MLIAELLSEYSCTAVVPGLSARLLAVLGFHRWPLCPRMGVEAQSHLDQVLRAPGSCRWCSLTQGQHPCDLCIFTQSQHFLKTHSVNGGVLFVGW